MLPVITAFWGVLDLAALGGTGAVQYAAMDNYNNITSQVDDYLKHHSIEINVTMALVAKWSGEICSLRFLSRTCSSMVKSDNTLLSLFFMHFCRIIHSKSL